MKESELLISSVVSLIFTAFYSLRRLEVFLVYAVEAKDIGLFVAY